MAVLNTQDAPSFVPALFLWHIYAQAASRSCDRYEDCGAYIGFLSNPPNLDTDYSRTCTQFAFLQVSPQQDPAGEGDHSQEPDTTPENVPGEPKPESNIAIERGAVKTRTGLMAVA